MQIRQATQMESAGPYPDRVWILGNWFPENLFFARITISLAFEVQHPIQLIQQIFSGMSVGGGTSRK